MPVPFYRKTMVSCLKPAFKTLLLTGQRYRMLFFAQSSTQEHSYPPLPNCNGTLLAVVEAEPLTLLQCWPQPWLVASTGQIGGLNRDWKLRKAPWQWMLFRLPSSQSVISISICLQSRAKREDGPWRYQLLPSSYGVRFLEPHLSAYGQHSSRFQTFFFPCALGYWRTPGSGPYNFFSRLIFKSSLFWFSQLPQT